MSRSVRFAACALSLIWRTRMPRQNPFRTSPAIAPDTAAGAAKIEERTGELTRSQIERLAEVIADGRSDFPDDLAAGDLDRLRPLVRRHLRQRLVHHIARAIAAALRGEGGPGTEEP